MRVKRLVRELRPHTKVTITSTSSCIVTQPNHITCKDACHIESIEEIRDLQIIDTIITGSNAITLVVDQEDLVWN